MEKLQTLIRQAHQVFYTWIAIPRGARFIRHHELWNGLRNYKWVQRMLLGAGAVISIYLISEFIDSIRQSSEVGVAQSLFAANGFLGRIGTDIYDSLFNGALKWIILILLEVVIYHFMRQSLKIIEGKEVENAEAFRPFIDAQRRMIIVSFMAYGIEIAMTGVVAEVFFGIFSFLSFLKPVFILFVQCALLGFAIVDNYYEQFGLKINQSVRYAREGFLGVCFGIGLPLFLVLKVPLIGAIVGPLVASVTVAIVMHELCDLNEVGYVPTEKELKKMEKKRRKAARKQKRKQYPVAD